MRALCGAAVVTLAIAGTSFTLNAQGTSAPAAQKPAAKTLEATGTVSAVTLDSISVKSKTESWTFVIDTKTEVTAKGASHKTVALKKDGKTPVLTDFVKDGDTVAVSFHEQGGAKHASAIRVTMAAPVKK